jgi:hypothetical protein
MLKSLTSGARILLGPRVVLMRGGGARAEFQILAAAISHFHLLSLAVVGGCRCANHVWPMAAA